MARVNFITSDHKRGVANQADLILRNRYFEQNPSLADDGASLIARPGLNHWLTVGTGPIRGLHSEPGAFDGDLFVVSGGDLFRVDAEGNSTFLVANLNNPDSGVVNMAITQAIGATPEYLFIADGQTLRVYEGPSATAAGILTSTGVLNNAEQVRIGEVYYQFTNASVDAGTPLGTSANPWLVAMGGTTEDGLTNLYNAINNTGVPGTSYSTALTAHDEAVATGSSPTTVTVQADFAGVQGNTIVTTETGTNLSWGAATLTGGLGGAVSLIATPDDIGMFDLVTIASYVICIPTQVGEFVGRFYWIEPGEIVVDPLNFATAESYPDRIMGVERFGDQFWLPGERSTEVWYPSGDPLAPMQRLRGVVFDRGTWEGTAVAIKETLIVVDGDGGVFAIRGGAPQRISNPGIEEQIRLAIANQQNLTL